MLFMKNAEFHPSSDSCFSKFFGSLNDEILKRVQHDKVTLYILLLNSDETIELI
jgi:hypothetical protein